MWFSILIATHAGQNLLGPFFLAFIIGVGFLTPIIAIDCREESYRFMLKCNPLRVYLWLPLIGIRWLFRNFSDVVVFLGTLGLEIIRFCLELLRIIYSEERLLCGISAAIGVAVCHYTHNSWLIGLASGVLWGVLNYEILSKRVFKLVSTP
jgi:hypothetical protein